MSLQSGPSPAGTLIWDFWPLELGVKTFLLFQARLRIRLLESRHWGCGKSEEGGCGAPSCEVVLTGCGPRHFPHHCKCEPQACPHSEGRRSLMAESLDGKRCRHAHLANSHTSTKNDLAGPFARSPSVSRFTLSPCSHGPVQEEVPRWSNHA